jgi:chromosome transmission fidelity protein 1
MPYNLLLQRGAREALGLNVNDKVVIVDEAHSA